MTGETVSQLLVAVSHQYRAVPPCRLQSSSVSAPKALPEATSTSKKLPAEAKLG